ncbi:AsmA family protein [Hirschia baltica]|uniref:AsmA family protein n=1 Tax=Hirschia baltica (strain ATCC 49814 / DSM 5838 / IFAM 1418) TaxID=582402 RepID=C6XIT3_HIRBI|nr:AsmA family protein [Hirschia baltica]ACT59028.1 AsmA family protein [Hirschia baltica ATCC 49814]
MIRFILIILAIFAVLIGGLVAAVHFIPSSAYKDKIETVAESALGRDVTINGDIKLRLFPKITASAGQTVIANPKGFGDSDFASMTELRAAVKILPLLSQKVEIDEFILVDPKLSLVKLENGENNWTFSSTSTDSPAPEDETPTNPDAVQARLGDVRLVNGDLSYDDRQAGQTHTLTKLNILIKLPEINGPLGVDGDGILDELPFELNADVENLQKLLEGVSTPVNADLKTDLATTGFNGNIVLGDVIGLDLTANAEVPDLQAFADFMKIEIPGAKALGKANVKAKVDGQVGALILSDVILKHSSDLLKIDFTGGANVGEKIAFKGDLDFNAPNLRALAQTADVVLPEGDIYRSFSLDGQTQGSLDSVSLSNATLKFDDIVGTGNMLLNLSGAKPKLTGNLKTNTINATNYAAASGATEKPKSTNKTDGWQDIPLDLSPLKSVDVDLKIEAEGLKFQGIDIGKTLLNTTIINGKLVADLTETSLYGGKGTAKIVADASAATPKVEMIASLNALNAAPFLGAVADFDKVEGVGGFNISINGTGASMSSIMSSLSGAGAFKFDDGAIKGLNAAQLMRSATEFLNTGTIPSALSEEQETDFTEFAADFNINKGVASTNAFNFVTPGLEIPGQGQLDLGNRTLSLSMFPKSGDKSLGINGFAPPIKISGSWNKLSVGLDQDWLKEQLTQQLKNEAQNLIQKELGLDKALGGNTGNILGSGKEADDARKEAIGNALGNALGIKKPAATPAPTATPSPTATADSATSSTETVGPEEEIDEEEKSIEEQLEEEAKKKLRDLFK